MLTDPCACEHAVAPQACRDRETGRFDGREEGAEARKRIERIGESVHARETDLSLLLEALQSCQRNAGSRGQVSLGQAEGDPAAARSRTNPILHLGGGVQIEY